MKLHKPYDTFVPKPFPAGTVTQFFGENPHLYVNICPVPGQCLKWHNGVDCVAPWGTPIMAVTDGIVADVKESAGGYGKHIRIITDTDEWVYGHLSEIQVVLGQQVVAGQIIGKMGNTGFVVSGATPYWKYNPYQGTHLHLGRRPFTKVFGLDPSDINYPNGQRVKIKDYWNGTFGYVPITAEDFEEEVPPPPVPTLDLTLQSLENNAVEEEKKGNSTVAALIRAIKGIVKAFWT